ncbi:hypothetical protein PMIN04_002109 [Paraphaeosphaeria minitans]
MPHPTATPSDTLTSITPPSLVDDGVSLSRRMPRAGHRDINSWLEGTRDSAAHRVLPLTPAASDTLYTGSFVDDGADMVYPTMPVIPGCGIVDRAFYSKGKPRKSKYDEEWTVEKEKALAGDMWRSLAKLRRVARVEVKDAGEADKREKRKRRKKHRIGAVEDDGRVRIPKPLKWGTFVIEGSDGRVVIVDKEAEYDSGRPGENKEAVIREVEYEEKIAKRKAKEAEKRDREHEKELRARAAAEARERRKREQEERARERATSDKQQRKEKHMNRRRHQPSSRLLTPIPEADTPEENATGIASPTKFFMTGAKSERSSTTHLPRMLSAEPLSPTKSPPGAWPASQLSSIKSMSLVESAKSPTALSTTTSITKSEDSWAEKPSWDPEASAVRLPSSASPGRYSDATPSTTSGAAPQGSRISACSWMPEGERSERSSLMRVASVGRSRADSVDTWRGDVDNDFVASPRKRTSSKNRSRGRSKDTGTENVDRHPARATSRRRRPRETSKPRSNDSWKRDVDEFESRISRRTSRSPNKSLMASVSAWIQDDDSNDVGSVHSPSKSATSRMSASSGKQVGNSRRAPPVRSHKSAGWRTSVVTPYSWRRQAEEVSDHSTAGSNGSRSRGPRPIPSDDRGSDGVPKAELDGDARSVKSHSTYRAPTVEDAQDSEDGAQEWNSAWSMKDSQKGEDGAEDGGRKAGVEGSVAGSARWSGKTGWGGDVETPGGVAEGAKRNGSGEGSGVEGDWKDQSGYEEGNDTWLNSEAGGVKYREAEWRKDAPAGRRREV